MNDQTCNSQSRSQIHSEPFSASLFQFLHENMLFFVCSCLLLNLSHRDPTIIESIKIPVRKTNREIESIYEFQMLLYLESGRDWLSSSFFTWSQSSVIPAGPLHNLKAFLIYKLQLVLHPERWWSAERNQHCPFPIQTQAVSSIRSSLPFD